MEGSQSIGLVRSRTTRGATTSLVPLTGCDLVGLRYALTQVPAGVAQR